MNDFLSNDFVKKNVLHFQFGNTLIFIEMREYIFLSGSILNFPPANQKKQ